MKMMINGFLGNEYSGCRPRNTKYFVGFLFFLLQIKHLALSQNVFDRSTSHLLKNAEELGNFLRGPEETSITTFRSNTQSTASVKQPAQSLTPNSLPKVILGQPTDNSITCAVVFDSNGIFWLSYGTDFLSQSTPTSTLKAGVVQFAVIINLQPSTTYQYQLNFKYDAGDEISTDVNSFTTQRYSGETFVFAVTADIHWLDTGFDEDVLGSSLSHIVEANPDFVIDIGDLFITAKLDTSAADLHRPYSDVFNFLSGYFQSAPLFLLNGNHDGEWSCGVLNCSPNYNGLALLRAKMRKSFFPNPVPNNFYSGNTHVQYPGIGFQANYYAWQWGSAFFVTLDAFWYTDFEKGATGWGWTLGEDQYFWLYNSLTNSQAQFKFVFIHNLLGGAFSHSSVVGLQSFQGIGDINWTKYFEWGGYDSNSEYLFDTYRPSWVEQGAVPIHQLFVNTGVACVFKGHDHLYYRGTTDDGVTYITFPHASVPESSSPQDDKVQLGYSDSIKSLKYSGGFGLVEVSEFSATITCKDFNGVDLDSFTLV